MKIYYSIVDPYPAYRSDLAELFGSELSRRGCDVTWYMSGSIDEKNPSSAFRGQKIYLPFSCSGKYLFLRKMAYLFSDCYCLVVKTNKHDLIQCRDKYIASLLAIVVAKFRNIPFTYWCSYPFPEQDIVKCYELSGFRKYFRMATAWTRFFLLYKVICKFADHVFVQSIRMKEDMAGYGVPASKMTAVPMGVPDILVNKNAAFNYHEKQIIYLGTLASVRKLEILIDVVNLVKKDVPDVKLVIVGEGDNPEERTALVNRVRNFGLEDNVEFTGHLPMQQAWKYVESSAICLSPFFPSKILLSTSPTKILEYMALGKVVICSHHPEQTKIINESGAGYAVDWSAEAFAEKIIYLIENPEILREMSKRGPSWVADNRIYSGIAAGLIFDYKRIIEKYHGR